MPDKWHSRVFRMSSREKYKHGLEALCATHTQESIKQFNNDLSTLSTAFCIALEQEINKKIVTTARKSGRKQGLDTTRHEFATNVRHFLKLT